MISKPHPSLQAYYREGVALQCLGKHAEALAAFSAGLAQDPKSLQLLAGLVEAAMKSPLKGKLLKKLPLCLREGRTMIYLKYSSGSRSHLRYQPSCLLGFPGQMKYVGGPGQF